MSRVLDRWLRRPAPSGAVAAPPRSEQPPDGWEVVDPSTASRAVSAIDSALLQLSEATRARASRRQFLEHTGAAGLALGLGLTGTLFRPSAARAHYSSCNVTDPNNQTAGPCGPSPLCSGTYCTSTNCAHSRADTQRRLYGTGSCTTSTNNCWIEHCCGTSYNGHARCCDCCAPSSGADCAGSCPNRRCICRSRVNTC